MNDLDGTFLDNSISSQRATILAFLQKGRAVTTLYARNILGICHPGMRICELRQAGHDIETIWVNETDAAGVLHRVGKYILKPNRQMCLFDHVDGKNGSRT